MPSRSNSSKYEFSDRNPTGKRINWGVAGEGPHATTTRATYTVPSGKKFMMGIFYGKVYITTAATTAGKRRILFEINVDGSNYIIQEALVGPDQNTPGQNDRVTSNINSMLLAGAKIDCISSDNSTGGTVDYNTNIYGVEYDA